MNLTQLERLNARADAALQRFAAIDLGYKYDDGLCESYDPKKTQYPSLYINKVSSDDVMSLPDEGKATIEYRLTGRNMRENNGKKTYGMTLDVLSFEPEAKAKADAKTKKEGGAVKLSQFADNRTRNGNGEFVGGETGGADPVSMRQAYGGKAKTNPLIPGAAAAALAGAGLLGSKAGRVMTVKAAKSGSRVVRAATAGLDRKLKGKTGEMWPRMGSKAPKGRRSEGLGEVIVRTATKATKAKTAAKWPRSGD